MSPSRDGAPVSPVADQRLVLAQKVVAPLPWAVMTIGLVINFVAPSVDDDNPQALIIALAIFFPLLVLRLVLAALLQPGRRVTLLLLTAAIIAWAIGSLSVNAARGDGQAEFPAPGEWLFLLSYLGMVGFLLRDVDRRQSRPARGLLDIVIVCGGTACVAFLLVVAPIQFASHQEGLSLLLALVYPLADLVLALVVLSQGLLQMRIDRRKSWMAGIAFALLAGADSAFALQISATTYDFGSLGYALWGAGFALLVAAACRPQQHAIRALPTATATPLLVGAGLVAVAVLTIRPDDTLAYYVLPPAVLTLATVGARLALALRDANRANEAFALSETDDLTNLPNRRAVRAWLSQALTDRQPLALMMLDLDGFKEINDSLGHRAGDTVLELVGVRLLEAVDTGTRIARLGGDEFAVLVRATDEIELVESARDLLRELAKPIAVEGLEISPSASIGVTVTTIDDDDSGDVLRRADVAMYQAKNSGSGVAVYDAQLDEFSRSRLLLAEELRRGITEGQIEVWYQPQVEAGTMRVSGLEALVRWRHPEEGVIGPVSFLPIARRAGLMAQLSDVVVDTAVRDLAQWQEAGLDLHVAINCAPPELLGPTFLPHLYRAIERSGITGESLVVEVTEDSFLSDPQRTRDIMRALRDHGVQVSIDDYGTGFSSLTYLRNLPVQELKIDRALIADITTDVRTAMIVASTVQLAHALEMRIVAEGVENATDLAFLADMGIDTIQGFHVARPMESSQIEWWVREWEGNADHPAPPAETTLPDLSHPDPVRPGLDEPERDKENSP